MQFDTGDEKEKMMVMMIVMMMVMMMVVMMVMVTLGRRRRSCSNDPRLNNQSDVCQARHHNPKNRKQFDLQGYI